MSNLTVRFFSDCLRRFTTFNMYLPDNGGNEALCAETKTLLLLHGYNGDGGNWVPEELSEKYNFAVVMPSGENSFWLDGSATGRQFCRLLGEELISYVRRVFGLARRREDIYIMGLSMGGFGALHTALYYPDTFCCAVGLSSALIVRAVAEMKEDDTSHPANEMANYEYYKECFGEPAKLLESDNNPEVLVKKIKESGAPMPDIYMACGTEDFLLMPNREFHGFLTEQGVAHVYEEDEGGHDMVFWSKYVNRFIPQIFGKKDQPEE